MVSACVITVGYIWGLFVLTYLFWSERCFWKVVQDSKGAVQVRSRAKETLYLVRESCAVGLWFNMEDQRIDPLSFVFEIE